MCFHYSWCCFDWKSCVPLWSLHDLSLCLRGFLLCAPPPPPAHLSLIPLFFSIPSSLSSAAETRASPWSMPLWSRSCCMSRAWPPLPRSWQNLKLSREVFANQDLIKSQGRKGKFARHFSPEVCWVKWDFFSVSLFSLLDSFHQRPDRRGRRWVDRVFTTVSKDSICWNHCNTDPSFYCWCELFMKKCDSKKKKKNLLVVAVLLLCVEKPWFCPEEEASMMT